MGDRSATGIRRLAAATLIITGILGMAGRVAARIPTPSPQSASPLTLSATGSFYVGGHVARWSTTETGLYTGGDVTVDQMYVQYMVPFEASGPSVVMVHGSTLTGKSFETTPDGRMGWYEYFVRKGFPAYVVDQVSRGRSGFNQAPFNNVRAGLAAPATQPNLQRGADDLAWVSFRFGPSVGVKYDDTQYPIEAVGEFSKQSVPDQTPSLPAIDANYRALSELATRLEDTVLLGHSQSGRYPFETALLDAAGISALVAIEPAGCKAGDYTSEQIARLAKLPILIVFGDHLETPNAYRATWATMAKDCDAFVARVNAAGGNAKVIRTSELGIHGNSHMLMQDRNNTRIADIIMAWIARNSRKK